MSKLIPGNYYKILYEGRAKNCSLIKNLQRVHGEKKFKCLRVVHSCGGYDNLTRVSFEGQTINSGSYPSPSWIIDSIFEKYFINTTLFEQEELDV